MVIELGEFPAAVTVRIIISGNEFKFADWNRELELISDYLSCDMRMRNTILR